MRERWRVLRENVRSHILFIPAIMVLLGMAAAFVFVELDRRLETDELREIPWIFRAGASGARQVLSTIATAMAQLAGITFSVTIVALALRSQQFGPRLLRNFTGDRLNQVILGAFVATFVYALLVLRAVRDIEENANLDDETFIPLVAVTFAILLALLTLGFFIVFIDRVVDSMQAESVVQGAAEETEEAIAELFPEPLGSEHPADHESELRTPEGGQVVRAGRSGYIQSVRSEHLMEKASEEDLVVYVSLPVGAFVAEGETIAVVASEGGVDERTVAEIRKAVDIGRHRTVLQDPEYGIQQIADVAVKALSPSQNDPNTAVTAVEYLSGTLVLLAGRKIPDRRRRDPRGRVRVFARGPNFRSMTETAFDQIREHARGDVAVLRTLVRAVGRISDAVDSSPRQDVLRHQIERISRAADEDVRDPHDRRAINDALATLGPRPGWSAAEFAIPEVAD